MKTKEKSPKRRRRIGRSGGVGRIGSVRSERGREEERGRRIVSLQIKKKTGTRTKYQ